MEYQIRPKRDVVTIFFFTLWLFGWAVGEISAINQIINNYHTTIAFLGITIWLIFWTFAGIGTLIVLLWILWGKEVVRVSREKLIIKKKLFWIELTTDYGINGSEVFNA